MAAIPAFAELAATPDPPLDQLALALAAELRDVDARAALNHLDALGAELSGASDAHPLDQARATAALLGGIHRFTGEREAYEHPRNSMLDVVLQRRRGLPIVLSVIYVEVGRRAGIPLAGVGLPGHFVVRHLGAPGPLLLDPFASGSRFSAPVPAAMLAPWSATEIAMRMLNNLVVAYQRRGNLTFTLRCAEMRLALPAGDEHRAALEAELRTFRANLN